MPYIDIYNIVFNFRWCRFWPKERGNRAPCDSAYTGSRFGKKPNSTDALATSPKLVVIMKPVCMVCYWQEENDADKLLVLFNMQWEKNYTN